MFFPPHEYEMNKVVIFHMEERGTIMRVLVTGGYGFVGSFVAERFYREGWDVSILDNLSTGRKAYADFKHRSYVMSVEDPACEEVFRSGGFDVVVHLAAQTDVSSSLEDPQEDARSNVLGLVNVLNLSAKYGVKKVIFSSSAAVYGLQEGVPIRESAPCAPISPYGISKWTGEQYLLKWRELFGLETLCFRIANVYGPRQGHGGEGGVVSAFIRRVLAGEELTIYGDGEQTRDFIYVGDVADAVYRAALSDLSGVYNLSTGKEISVNELAETIARLHGEPVRKIHRDPRPGDIRRSALDSSRLRRDLDWAPRYSFQEGLAKTYEWFRDQMRKASSAAGRSKSGGARIRRFFNKVAPFLEHAVVFALVAWFILALPSWAAVIPDLKLLYIALMGILFGWAHAAAAVALSWGLYVYELLVEGRDLIVLVHDPNFFFQLAAYLIVGLVAGYAIERKKRALKDREEQTEALEERYRLLREVYDETRLLKDELYEQILNHRESFGKICAATRALESLEPEVVLTSLAGAVENVLRTESVAVYITGRPGEPLRLAARSAGCDAPCALQTETSPWLRRLTEERRVFVNRELHPDAPLMAAPVEDGRTVRAVIAVYDLPFAHMSLHHLFLLAQTAELASSALRRAVIHEEATSALRRVAGTDVLKPQTFAALLEHRRTLREKHGMGYALLKADLPEEAGAESAAWVRTAQQIAPRLRPTDCLGCDWQGRLLLLLSDLDARETADLIARIESLGVRLSPAEEGMRHAG